VAQWYCMSGGVRYGPVEQDALSQWLAEGRINSSDLVWREGLGEWAPAAQFPELQQAPLNPVATGPAYNPTAPRRRPGGLTALAVLNFVFGGLGVLSTIIGVISWLVLRSMMESHEAGMHDLATAFDKAGLTLGHLVVTSVLRLISSAVLIAAGAGYLKMTRTGYILGHVYAGLALINILVNLAVTPGLEGFLGAIGELIYPIITIALLNTVFKKCFT